MTPEELLQLCLKRLLSGDHMRYFVKIANQQEPEILYVYVMRCAILDQSLFGVCMVVRVHANAC